MTVSLLTSDHVFWAWDEADFTLLWMQRRNLTAVWGNEFYHSCHVSVCLVTYKCLVQTQLNICITMLTLIYFPDCLCLYSKCCIFLCGRGCHVFVSHLSWTQVNHSCMSWIVWIELWQPYCTRQRCMRQTGLLCLFMSEVWTWLSL